MGSQTSADELGFGWQLKLARVCSTVASQAPLPLGKTTITVICLTDQVQHLQELRVADQYFVVSITLARRFHGCAEGNVKVIKGVFEVTMCRLDLVIRELQGVFTRRHLFAGLQL